MRNYTQSVTGDRMTAAELKEARQRLGFGQSDLARALRVPLRTLQDWEADRRKIPGIAQVAVALYAERDRWVMKSIVDSAVDAAARQFPTLFKTN